MGKTLFQILEGLDCGENFTPVEMTEIKEKGHVNFQMLINLAKQDESKCRDFITACIEEDLLSEKS